MQQARKAAKADNKNGDPISLKSKILAAVPDPASSASALFIAESAGFVRRVNLEVSNCPALRGQDMAQDTCVSMG